MEMALCVPVSEQLVGSGHAPLPCKMLMEHALGSCADKQHMKMYARSVQDSIHRGRRKENMRNQTSNKEGGKMIRQSSEMRGSCY